MYRPAAHIQDDELYLPAGQLGMGWWGDAWDEVKSVAKKVQANPVVRGLEKKAVDYGSKALRGAAESAVDGLADSALSAVGAPELAPMADKLIDEPPPPTAPSTGAPQTLRAAPFAGARSAGGGGTPYGTRR